MITQRAANLIFAAILICLAGWMAWLASSFETPPLGDATLPTEFFPLFLLGFIVVCIFIYVREYLVHGQSGGDHKQPVFADRLQVRTGAVTLAVVVAGYAIWVKFGFLAAGVITPPAIAFAMGTRKAWHYVIILTGAVLTYLVFTYGLGTQFR